VELGGEGLEGYCGAIGVVGGHFTADSGGVKQVELSGIVVHTGGAYWGKLSAH